MRSQDLKRAKRSVRRRVLAARDALSPAVLADAAAAVTSRCLSLPEVQRASTVMAFSSFGSELPLDGLIEALVARGVLVALPAIVAGDLQARTYRPGDPTTVTSFGAREPEGGRTVDPAAIDVVITPAVAYDREGRRVGYGGGFYDRFLPRTRSDALRLGVGVRAQLLDDPLPAGAFDQRVDVVLTPEETVRCRREP